MPEIVRCPECNRQLRVPDNLLGKKVRCPGCKTTFPATVAPAEESPPAARQKPAAPPQADFEVIDEPTPPRKPAPRRKEQYDEAPRPQLSRKAAPPPSEEPDFEEVSREEEEEREGLRPPRRRRRSESSRAGWQRVRLGITLVIIGVFVGLAVSLIWGIGSALTGAFAASSSTTTTTAIGSQTTTVRQSAGSGALGIILGIVVIGMVLTYRGLTVAGYGFCLPVPRVSEAKTLATATFILGIVNTLMPIITCVIAYVVIGAAVLAFLSERSSGALAGAGIVVLVLSILTIVLVISEVIAFLQFLRMITLHLGAVGLAKSISYLLLLGLVILVLALLMVVILMLGGSVSTSQGWGAMLVALAGCGCIDGVLMLGWFVWYVITLFFVRSTLSHHIAD